MLLQIELKLRAAIATFVKEKGVEFDPASLPVEFPPSADMGDLAVPMFPLAKALKKAPKVIAQEIAAVVSSLEGVEKAEAAGAGYLNVFLDRGKALEEMRNAECGMRNKEKKGGKYSEFRIPHSALGKVIVEHTSINPNKAAHVGHLRNAVLGDTWARLLRASGAEVEVQNLIDDLGVQVADVVNGFLNVEKKSLTDIQKLALFPQYDFDDYCWDLYATVQSKYESVALDEVKESLKGLNYLQNDHEIDLAIAAFLGDEYAEQKFAHDLTRKFNAKHKFNLNEEGVRKLFFSIDKADVRDGIQSLFLENISDIKDLLVNLVRSIPVYILVIKRRAILKKLEIASNPEFTASQYIAKRIVWQHLTLMQSLSIHYDLLVWESDIVHNNLWERTFEKLKTSGKIVEEKDGKNKGCWVVPLQKSPEFEKLENADKVLVRSDGTATYVAKDIACQMWKFGLADVEFPFEPFGEFESFGGGRLYRTASSESPTVNRQSSMNFGKAFRVYNVIDVRQEYLQKIVAESLRVTGYEKQADNSVHFSYEMVALTPKTAEALGFALTDEEKKKPYVEMSGRKGFGVKAKDLMRRLEDKAAPEIAKRNPDFTPAQVDDAARKISVAALRYFMLRYTRNKVVAFDIDEAVQFEGETGPYLQYALVRVKNIFAKCEEAGIPPSAICQPQWSLDASAWNLLMLCARFEHALSTAVKSEEPSVFARYAFELAQAWSGFYHGNPILQEKDEAVRSQRLALAFMFEQTMTRALGLLGIEAPERM